VSENSSEEYTYMPEILPEACLGDMFLIINKYLMVRNSTEILFFRIEEDPDTEERSWVKYFSIPSRGQIYYVRGTTRI